MYNGKTSLWISYQYHILDSFGDDVTILGRDFDTLDEALEVMENIMPDCYEGDDGYDLDEWEKEIAKGEDPDIFTQYAANIDDEHCFLAILRPRVSKKKNK